MSNQARGRPHDGVDRSSIVKKFLRPAAAEEWLRILAELRTVTEVREPAAWPADERLVLTMYDDQGQPMKALTFQAQVAHVDDAEGQAGALRQAMRGTAAVILTERRRRGAEQLPILVRVEPVPALGLDMSVIVRCRIGFLRTEPEEVQPQRSDQLPDQSLLSDEAIAEQAARADREWGK